MSNNQSEIKFTVNLDQNKIPETLAWTAIDGGIENEETKALLISVWDNKAKETLRIDLWTKDMPVDEMKQFFHQTLVAMADTYQRATNDEKMAGVELLSPGTEDEDLGQTLREVNKPPTKWQVYEQILQIPYYFLFNRYNNQFRAFQLIEGIYQPMLIAADQKVWLEESQLGLGVWQGAFQGMERLWLRWFDRSGNWIPTPEEYERQRADRAEQKAALLAAKLRELGIEVD